MAGFINCRALASSLVDDGRTWISTYRKAIASTATIAGQWYDYSYAGGNPIANYYAAAPLQSAVLEPEKGIILPRISAGESMFLHRWVAMSAAASATSTANANQAMVLMDYLMFYPFIDMDAAGEDQSMTQSATLPRYSDGVGVQMIVVAQSGTIGGGRFTITYTDSNGNSQTTPSLFCAAAQPSGAIVHATGAAGGLVAFVPLNAGVNGVRSVESVNFSVANGGLCCIVLVKPIETQWLREESRTTTSGTIESFGDAAEKEAMRTRAGMAEIKDGAFIGIMGMGANGSLASSVLVGTIEVVWR